MIRTPPASMWTIPVAIASIVMSIDMAFGAPPAAEVNADGDESITIAVRYVDDSAPLGGDGLSWATAFSDLQSALDAAPAAIPPGGGLEIHIGQGVYRPTRRIDPKDPRSATYQMFSSTACMGGYAGWGAPDPDARDVDLYPTTLSGDLNGDDGPPGSFANYGDNAYHVVITSGVDVTCILDGLHITAGNACCGLTQTDPRGFGGGVQNLGGSPTLINCRLRYCVANRGAGVYTELGNPSFFGCIFESNEAQGINREGGGLHNINGDVLLNGCTFQSNQAFRGGGLFHRLGDATLVNCHFVQNSAFNSSNDGDGGGIFQISSFLQVQGCIFEFNEAVKSAGALKSFDQDTTIIEDCQFTGNEAGTAGGALHQSYGALQLRRCSFTDNEATDDGDAGAVSVSNGAPLIEDCVFTSNAATDDAGALHLFDCAAGTVLRRCDFIQNSAASDGGAIHMNKCHALVTDCLFQSNVCASNGGAVYNLGNGASPAFVNCLFVNNRGIAGSSRGGALYNHFSASTVINCTFSGNMASTLIVGGGGGIAAVSAPPPAISNSILWGNVPDQIKDYTGVAIVRYCDVQGGWSGAGDHNINANPSFANPTAGDYSLAPGSPCIDAADNAAIPVDIVSDLAGNPRFRDDPGTRDTGNGFGAIADMGCYEFQRASPICPEDCHFPPNGVVNIDDLLTVITSWGATGPAPADVDLNLVVNIDDLLLVILAWGSCPQ